MVVVINGNEGKRLTELYKYIYIYVRWMLHYFGQKYMNILLIKTPYDLP